MNNDSKNGVNRLIARYKSGDVDAFDKICEQFGNMVKSIARAYFLVGGDREDLLQEGFLGLLKAVNGYEEEHGIAFSTYAYTCILNNIKKAVRKANSKTNLLLSNAIPLETVTLINTKNPEDLMITTETGEEIKNEVKKLLSPFEYRVFELYLSGLSYKEIATETEKQTKSIDNALKRIKEKITENFKA